MVWASRAAPTIAAVYADPTIATIAHAAAHATADRRMASAQERRSTAGDSPLRLAQRAHAATIGAAITN